MAYNSCELNTLHEIFMNLEYSMENRQLEDELADMINELWKLANRTTIKLNKILNIEIAEPYYPT